MHLTEDDSLKIQGSKLFKTNFNYLIHFLKRLLKNLAIFNTILKNKMEDLGKKYHVK